MSVDPVGGEVGLSQSWNRYVYVEDSPVAAIDPDGRLKRKKNGELVFKRGSIVAIRHPSNPSIAYVVQRGHLFTDEGRPVEASTVEPAHRSDATGKIIDTSTTTVVGYAPNATNPVATDCHGYTFADGQYWINNDQVDTILRDDGYQRVTGAAQIGDVMVFRNKSGEVVHSVTVIAVDSRGNVTKVRGLAGVETEPHDDTPDDAWKDPTATREIYRRASQ